MVGFNMFQFCTVTLIGRKSADAKMFHYAYIFFLCDILRVYHIQLFYHGGRYTEL